MERKIIVENFIKSMMPPTSKDLLYKWMYKIPYNNIDSKQKEALKYLIKIY
jgi:hypothetical protein